MNDEAPSRSLDKFVLRFPSGMREWIASEAEKRGRSMNAEIIYRLERSLLVELPSDWEVRASIVGGREFANQAIEALKAVLAMSIEKKSDGVTVMKMPGGKTQSIDEAISATETTLDWFVKQRDKSNALLSEIAIAEVQGLALTADQIQERIKEHDFQLSPPSRHDQPKPKRTKAK